LKLLCALLFTFAVPIMAQNPPAASPDPLKPLAFLEGNWDAKAQGNGGTAASGSYVFRTELGGHVLARHSRTADCKGAEGFDCEHGDLLYVYADGPGQPLKAIYFDSEGHTIHYNVTTPTPTTAVFLSDGSQPGPRFQLVYSLQGAVMSGKFQMQMPGQTTWNSYLEWSGGRK
jgi:hypothetical protein